MVYFKLSIYFVLNLSFYSTLLHKLSWLVWNVKVPDPGVFRVYRKHKKFIGSLTKTECSTVHFVTKISYNFCANCICTEHNRQSWWKMHWLFKSHPFNRPSLCFMCGRVANILSSIIYWWFSPIKIFTNDYNDNNDDNNNNNNNNNNNHTTGFIGTKQGDWCIAWMLPINNSVTRKALQ